MESKNILAEIKSKSLKEVKKEINDILNKLENTEMDLKSSTNDYQRLIKLNNHMETLFREKSKKISLINKKT
jgi:exonuclease VII small subunit